MLNIEKIKSAIEPNNELISTVQYFEKIDSTNLYAKSAEVDDGVLVLTDFQTQGMGRMKKKWESVKGKNLTFTIKKHFEIDTRHIQSVNFFFSYYILAYLKDFIAKKLDGNSNFPDLKIKWPNDILLDSKKICGLLIENTVNQNQFVIGIGLNVNQETFPDEFDYKTTSLRNCLGFEIDTTDLLIQLIDIFSKNIYFLKKQKYRLIFNLWKNSTGLVGKEVLFSENGENPKSGKIIDLLDDGGLKMDFDRRIRTFYSGEIKLVHGTRSKIPIQH